MTYGWPCDPNIRVTQYFGEGPNPAYQPDGHTGMDFATPVGSNLYSIGDGVVLHADWADNLRSNPYLVATKANSGFGGAGIIVIINHGAIISIYGHMNDTHLNVGDRVARGQLIGHSGATGHVMGAHLHLDVLPVPYNVRAKWYGRINPNQFISKNVTAEVPVASNQRLSGPLGANQRTAPNTSAEVVRIIPGNALEEFTGFTNAGENVNGSTLWYKDNVGYVHSSAFTEQKTDGLTNETPKAVSLTPTQRVAGEAGVKYRPEPNTSKTESATYNPGDILNFVGFTNAGENVNGNSIWFKGIGGGWVWSGGLTDGSTDGLPDLSPKATPAPTTPATSYNQRTVGPDGVNYRKAATAASESIQIYNGGDVLNFKGFVHGENVNGSGNDVWFVGALTGGYAWSGGFTSQSTTGLVDLTPIVVNPTPVVTPPVSTPVEKPVDNSSVVSPDGLKTVTEWIPAHPDNFQVGNFPALSECGGGVVHQFGALGIGINSVISYFQMSLADRIAGELRANPNRTPTVGPSSSQFVVEDERVVQMVELSNRAFHAGKGGNDFIGIETSPVQSAKTIASVNRLLDELYSLGLKPKLFLHKNVPGNSTECGSLINLANYHSSLPAPVPTPTPTPVSKDISLSSESVALIQKYLGEIDNILKEKGK
jgi:murein DD-endopeptidase MepM/ murein hydrolase activator NlpD